MNNQPPPLPHTLPANVGDAFATPHLKAADLPAGGVTLTIARLVWKWLLPKRDYELKLLAYFSTASGQECKKYLILNKTQCQAIAAIVGSEEFANWLDRSVHLAPAKARGKDTIAVSHPATAATGEEKF